MVKDAFVRLGLPIEKLRGMGFDGAANMYGIYNGAQALLRESQPLAVYVHCGAHCVNLVGQDACEASSIFRNAFHTVHEVGVLFKDSIRFRTAFEAVTSAADCSWNARLPPLCPTR